VALKAGIVVIYLFLTDSLVEGRSFAFDDMDNNKQVSKGNNKMCMVIIGYPRSCKSKLY
jgi:hypothetical protein